MKNIDWRWVAVGVVLAVGAVIVSVVAFPAWTASNIGLLTLVVVVIVGVTGFLANMRGAFGKREESKPRISNKSVGQTGGVNIGGGNVTVGGHIIGGNYDADALRAPHLFTITAPPRDFTGRTKR